MPLSISKISNDKIEQIHQELAVLQRCIYRVQVPAAGLDVDIFNTIEDCLINLKQLFNDAGLIGMLICCERLQINLSSHLISGDNLSAEECALILEWKSLIKAFIFNLNNERIADAIVENLAKENWIKPVDDQYKKKIKSSLLCLNHDSNIAEESDKNNQESYVEDFKSDDMMHKVDLDLGAEKYSDHDSIDLNDAVSKSNNSPSSQLLDDIESELFTGDDDFIIINEVVDNNSVVEIDEDLLSPANDAKIEPDPFQDSSVEGDQHNLVNVFDETQQKQQINLIDHLSTTNALENELFSAEELTEIDIATIELNTIEEEITWLTSDKPDVSANEDDDSSGFLEENSNIDSQNKTSENLLQSIEDELFLPGDGDIISVLSTGNESLENNLAEQNTLNEKPDALYAEEFSESQQFPEVELHDQEREENDVSDLMLASVENEPFSPDPVDQNTTSQDEESIVSSPAMNEVLLASEFEEQYATDENNDNNQVVDDIINSLYTDTAHISIDDHSASSAGKTNDASDDDSCVDNDVAEQNNEDVDFQLDYPDWSEEQKELLNLIVVEVEDALHQQSYITASFLASPIQETEIREFMSLYVEQVERMASAAEMVGLIALQKTCEIIHDYFLQYEKELIEIIINSHKTILLWPQVVLDYLRDIYSTVKQAVVIEYLSDSAWCEPINVQQITELQALFLSSTIHVEHNEEDKRKDFASELDVCIAIPDDVQAELLDGLLQELPSQTEEFSHAVQALDDNDFLRHLEIAQRIAHTIKGAANTVGIPGLANITHNLEDILSVLTKNKVKPTANLQSALIDGSDCLEQMTEYLLGSGSEPQDSVHTLQVILDWANYIDEFGPPVETDDQVSSRLATKHSVEDIPTYNEVVKPKTSEPDLIKHNVEAALRIPAATIDNLLMQSGENIIATSQMHDQVKQLLASLRDVKSNRDHVQEISQSLEHLIDIQGVGGRYLHKADNQKFDPLELDQYNELHTYSRRLIEATNDSVELVKQLEGRLTILDALISDQVSAQKESQYDMLKTRMVQVDSIAARLKRGVRQAAKICDKSVVLEITGGEILVDNKILVNLIDPLMHLLRNAVDHGLESDEERQLLNKPLPATVSLEVRQDGDRMIVLCRDDGRGLDVERIRNRAIEFKLISLDQELDEDQLKQLILQHGFSTRSEVTQLSGRGVGLDVVSSQVKSMNGLLSVYSELNKGTSFELSMPVSLLSAHALLVELSIGSVAISTVGVEEIIHLEKSQVIKNGAEYTYTIDDQSYRLIHIEHLLGLPENNTVHKSSFYTGLKISNEAKIILVPTISNTREIIIKPFSKYLPRVAGLIGTTILGNGEISSVIDIRDLLEYNSKNNSQQQPKVIDVDLNQQKLTALIVEDSLSTRKSLAEFMRDLHYEVYTAKDGLEAIDIMSACQPNIILSDLEMPRMNGLELTSHLRANHKTKDIPVIMITSRTTEKHIQEAKSIGVNEYLTKPFREDILFEKVNQLAPMI